MTYKHTVVILASGLVLLGAPAPAGAQAVPSALTLEEAIRLGVSYEAILAEFEAGRAAAGLPIVALQGGYTRTNHVDEFAVAQLGRPVQVIYPDEPDNYRTRLDLQWPIYSGGRTDALRHARLLAAARPSKPQRAGVVTSECCAAL